jgi:hypothetical protein
MPIAVGPFNAIIFTSTGSAADASISEAEAFPSEVEAGFGADFADVKEQPASRAAERNRTYNMDKNFFIINFPF